MRQNVMVIDDSRKRSRIAIVADVPLGGPYQPGVGQPLRTFRHARQPQICGIG